MNNIFNTYEINTKTNKNKMIKGAPSALTLTSLILGMWSLRFAINAHILQATYCVMICVILDGLDGKLARYLEADNEFGATLDTLADFTSFAIAPSLLIYLTFPHERLLWIGSLVFAISMALRLARFAQSKAQYEGFFIGVPAPAGALIALTPIFAFLANLHNPSSAECSVFLILSALLMISRIPTFAIAKIKIPTHSMPIFGIMLTVLISYIIFHPWHLILLCNIGYMCSFVFSALEYKKLKNNKQSNSKSILLNKSN